MQSSLPSSSSSSPAVHDEGLLRYILNEAISGPGSWPADFRAEVGQSFYRTRDRLAEFEAALHRTQPVVHAQFEPGLEQPDCAMGPG